MLLLYIFFKSNNEAYMIAFLLFVLMKLYRTLIYDYVYVVMFDYVVQVGELLEFLYVDFHMP